MVDLSSLREECGEEQLGTMALSSLIYVFNLSLRLFSLALRLDLKNVLLGYIRASVSK